MKLGNGSSLGKSQSVKSRWQDLLNLQLPLYIKPERYSYS